MTREQEHRQQEAARLLAEPLFNDALAALEAQAMEQVLSATGEDADRLRREAADRINVIRGVKSHLETIVTQGQQERRPRAMA
jgi:hypothetical protein